MLVWRRSYDIAAAAADAATTSATPSTTRATPALPRQMPLTECLKDTVARVMPDWDERHRALRSAPARRVLIAAHGNSLRALIKIWTASATPSIVGLNMPNGLPLVYELDDDLKPIRHYYLGDQAEVAKRIAAVSAQGKAKA